MLIKFVCLVDGYMGWSKIHLMLVFLTTLVFNTNLTIAQSKLKEYTNLNEALKNPDKVVKLNLENQSNTEFFKQISKFKNLEYLNLRNTEITTLPQDISTLQNLKTLDIGHNNISVLPKSFADLKKLTELYLDEEKNLALEEDIEILSQLKSLRILHLENNNISTLPKNLIKLNQLEKLYLNENQLNLIPVELKELKNLKYLDIHHNPIVIPVDVIKKTHGGLKINF